jgi:hypothetical protein
MAILASTALALCLFAPKPDIVTPGFKKVAHQVAVGNSADFEEWAFYGVTPLGPAGITAVVSDDPFTYSSKYGTKIYALPAGTEVPELKPREWADWAVDALVAYPDVQTASQVTLLSATESVLTTIEIVSVSEGILLLESVAIQHFDEDGEPVSRTFGSLVTWVLVGCGIGGLFAVAMRRKRRAA